MYAGNPAKKLKEGVFFTSDNAHKYHPQKDNFNSDIYIYEKSDFLGFEEIKKIYEKQYTNQEKIILLSSFKKDKNRFYME